MPTNDNSGHIEAALFGSVALYRAECPDCETTAIVLDGRLQCCGEPMRIPESLSVSRKAINADSRHQRPRVAEARAILSEQDNRCLYCGLVFGSEILRGFKVVSVNLTWDHILPYSYAASGRASNFAAACQICNGIKCDRIFGELEAARIYIRRIRKAKGYSD